MYDIIGIGSCCSDINEMDVKNMPPMGGPRRQSFLTEEENDKK